MEIDFFPYLAESHRILSWTWAYEINHKSYHKNAFFFLNHIYFYALKTQGLLCLVTLPSVKRMVFQAHTFKDALCAA